MLCLQNPWRALSSSQAIDISNPSHLRRLKNEEGLDENQHGRGGCDLSPELI